jgi:hypothetical protein
MVSLEHPSFETLLLWQSRELSPEQAATVKAHLAVCRECCAQLSEVAGIFEDLGWVSTEAAQRSMRLAITRKRRKRTLANRKVAAGIATVLIGALLVFTFSELTPEARADSLLLKAVREEMVAVPSRHLIRFQSGENQCLWAVGPDSSQSIPVSLAPSSFCGLVASNLRSAGWTNPLSARSFQQWRNSLKKKSDTVTKLATGTEVTTKTSDGPLRSATLCVRISDYRTVEARFQFANSTGIEQSAVDVTEEEAPLQVTTLLVPAEPHTPAHNAPPVPAFADPMDETEAQVRLRLHRLGVDANVLLAVERKGAGIRVWGVVPASEAKSAISSALRDLPNIEVNVLSESEEVQQQATLPWTAAHGDQPPLASEQIKTLFNDHPADHQVFLNGLDAVTRRLAGEAATRDALLALASRLRSSEVEEPLQKAIADLDSRMTVDTSVLATQLEPLTGRISGRAKPLSYPQAMKLYTLVHDVTFQSRSREPLALDNAFARIRALIAKG